IWNASHGKGVDSIASPLFGRLVAASVDLNGLVILPPGADAFVVRGDPCDTDNPDCRAKGYWLASHPHSQYWRFNDYHNGGGFIGADMTLTLDVGGGSAFHALTVTNTPGAAYQVILDGATLQDPECKSLPPGTSSLTWVSHFADLNQPPYDNVTQ